MNAKLAAGISHDSLAEELLNPFVHHLELETTYEKIKVSQVPQAHFQPPSRTNPSRNYRPSPRVSPTRSHQTFFNT
jgi:hypothetical protein